MVLYIYNRMTKRGAEKEILAVIKSLPRSWLAGEISKQFNFKKLKIAKHTADSYYLELQLCDEISFPRDKTIAGLIKK